MEFTFDSFVDGSFDYDAKTSTHTCLWLREEQMSISGGKISVADIDKLKDYPKTDVVRISGLRQDTFEYFIQTYGNQFKAISFFKNKLVEDWSLLGTLPNVEYLSFFANQRINSLWDMSANHSLTGLCIEDFSRLSSIEGIQTAPALRDFRIGNAIWDTITLDSLMPIANCRIERLWFYGKSITDNNVSFLADMPDLKQFEFPTNMLSMEQVAWIAANFPQLEGYALNAKIDTELFDSALNNVPGVILVGKRKPSLVIKGNEKRIEKHIRAFEDLKKKYKDVPYKIAFPEQ